MSDQGDVKFRRVGGRVIPIHVKDLAKAGGYTAGGVAVGIASGNAAAKKFHAAALVANKAVDLGKAADAADKVEKFMLGIKLNKMQIRHEMTAKKMLKSASSIRNFGLLTSTALIATGVNKALNHTELKDNDQARLAASIGAGAAAQFAIRSAFLRGVGNRGFDVIRKAASKAFR